MSKKYEVSREFILEAHKSACGEWRQRLEDTFPEAFKTRLNQWLYMEKEGKEYLWFYADKYTRITEGFYRGEYMGGKEWITGEEFARRCVPAEKKTVERIFMAEVKKRGYHKSYINTLNRGDISSELDLDKSVQFVYDHRGLEIIVGSKGGMYTVYKFGEWMEIVEVLTVEEAEAKYKIKIKS